ncbi:DUF6765 family protein [Undibacterium sp. SXout11W]|uniref:DUF6765 family protein n=1 Tax=Undibacterium sp. SXout11W TaxID=3413050 RepID=UPI003BF1CCFD
MDPTGLYQIDMHYYMVFFLALTSGLDTQVARNIALASQYIDDNPLTTPVNTNVNGEVDVYASITTNQTRLQYYHFMADTLDNKANIHTIMKGNQLNNLYNAYLNAPSSCAKQSFFGETLHALADTYSHAKTDDTPYRGVDLGLGIGHGLNDSDPDYTFNHWGYSVFVNKLFPGSQPNANNGGTYWGTNAGRTLSAKQAMFDQFTQQTTWSRSSDHDFLSVLETLIEFNKTGESEQYDFSWDDQGNQTRTKHAEVNHDNVDSINAAFSKKLDILDAALEEMGINVNMKDPAWAYNESLAADNRTKALGSLSCDEKNDAGEFKYAGTILPSKACPRPPNP